MKNQDKCFSISLLRHRQCWPNTGDIFSSVNQGERPKETENNYKCSKVSNSLKSSNDCREQSWFLSRENRPVDPRERWRRMSIRGLYENEDLQNVNSRKRAHLKSEINYNWEKNMQIGGNRKPILRRKEHNVASRFFGFASRGKKLKWTCERKKKSNYCNFQIPAIVISEAP